MSNIILILIPIVLFCPSCIFHPLEVEEKPIIVQGENCTIRYGDEELTEGSEIFINRKLYKVEDCQLQRAYQTCGSLLWGILYIVCEAIETQKLIEEQDKMEKRYTKEKLLTDACCLNACTINEISRYCP